MAKYILLFCVAFLISCGGTTNEYNYYEESCDDMAPPTKNLGWQKTGTLLTGQLGAAQPTSLNLQAGFQPPHGDGAEIYTVSFAVQPPSDGVYTTVADISFSTAGNSYTRRVSVAGGTSISGPADHVKVNAFDQTNPVVSNGKAYRIDMLVTKGCRPTTGQPPKFFVDRFVILAGGVASVPIPTSFGVTSVNLGGLMTLGVATPPTGTVPLATDLLGIFGVSGTSIAFSAFGVDPEGANWVPVPPGANILYIRNNGVTNALVGVTFGIDG